MPTYLWQGKFHNSNSRNQFIRNMTFMKIVQFFWYTVLQGTMMQFSHLFDAPLLTPLASILVGNYLFQGRFKSHFCYYLLQNYPSLNTQSCIKELLVVRDFCFLAIWTAGSIHKKFWGPIMSNF